MDAESFIGSIGTFAGSYAPRGWLDCDGRTIYINEHPALFSIIGSTYGGDSIHEFSLPDLRPEVDGRRVDWSAVKMPRQCICVEGIYPMRD